MSDFEKGIGRSGGS